MFILPNKLNELYSTKDDVTNQPYTTLYWR